MTTYIISYHIIYYIILYYIILYYIILYYINIISYILYYIILYYIILYYIILYYIILYYIILYYIILYTLCPSYVFRPHLWPLSWYSKMFIRIFWFYRHFVLLHIWMVTVAGQKGRLAVHAQNLTAHVWLPNP